MSTGISFTDIKEAKSYGDQLYEQGKVVNIIKRGKDKFLVKSREAEDGEKPAPPTLHHKVIKKAGDVVQPMGKIVGRGLRSPSEFTLGVAMDNNPQIYNPVKGGQRARIAELPELTFPE